MNGACPSFGTWAELLHDFRFMVPCFWLEREGWKRLTLQGDGKGLDSLWSFNTRHTIASKPVKGLAPPGLIATGIPWLDHGPGQATLQSPFASPRSRSPSPLPPPPPPLPPPLRLEHAHPSAHQRVLSPLRSLSPTPEQAWPQTVQAPFPIVTRAVSQASSVPAPIPLASSEATQTARSTVSRMTTNPCVGRVIYLPPITVPASGTSAPAETPASRSRSISPLRSPCMGSTQGPRIISDVVVPGLKNLPATVEEP